MADIGLFSGGGGEQPVQNTAPTKEQMELMAFFSQRDPERFQLYINGVIMELKFYPSSGTMTIKNGAAEGSFPCRKV